MSQELNLNPDEQALEAALAQLRPATPGFDARAVRLAAGLRNARRQVWFWRAAAAGLLVAGLLWQVIAPQRQRIIERTVVVPGPETKTYVVVGDAGPQDGAFPLEAPRPNYLTLRDRVLTAGVWVLPGRVESTGVDADRNHRHLDAWDPFNPEQL